MTDKNDNLPGRGASASTLAPKPSGQDTLLLTAADAARLLHISERHFWKLHAAGRVPRPIRLGRTSRWRRDELRRWVDAGAPARDRWEGMKKK